MEPLLNYGRPA